MSFLGKVLNGWTVAHMLFSGVLMTLVYRNVLLVTYLIIVDSTQYEPCYDPELLLSFRKCVQVGIH